MWADDNDGGGIFNIYYSEGMLPVSPGNKKIVHASASESQRYPNIAINDDGLGFISFFNGTSVFFKRYIFKPVVVVNETIPLP